MYNGFYSKITDKICIWHEWAICCSICNATRKHYFKLRRIVYSLHGLFAATYQNQLWFLSLSVLFLVFFLYSFCFAHRLFSTQDENFFFWIESIVYGNARRKQNKKIIGKKWFALVHHLKWMIVNRLAVSLQSIFIQVFSFNDDIRDSECNELITHNNFVLRFFCSDSI